MRGETGFSRAATAAPHQAAADDGAAILREGGNAIEAMVAMAASIALVYPHMNSFGGDGFWVIRAPSGAVRYVEAAGFAGALATPARYRERGYDAIPMRGPDAALTVPGAMGGWALALEFSGQLGGRLPLALLLAPALERARAGVPVSASESRTVPNLFDALKEAPGFAPAYLMDGAMPAAGHVRRLPVQADLLDRLAAAGLDDFYRGDVAHEIAADLERIDAPVTRADLASYRAVDRPPLQVQTRFGTLYNAPPPTQGLASLAILALFDRLSRDRTIRPESFDHHHALIEAVKRGLALRDRVVTDFAALARDPQAELAPALLDREAARIDMGRAAPFPLPPEHSDTVWMGAIDASGLAVSYIQSTYWEYGSGCFLPRSGVLMQNRGGAFSLDPASRNPLAPGRRPFHTLNPALVVLPDGRVMSYGSMGGDGQPQFQAQVFTRYAVFGGDLAYAVDAPRWLLGRTWGDSSVSLKYEDRFDDRLISALDRAGHELEAVGKPYSDGLGHAGAVVRHAKGHVEAVHDPRSDGGAAGH